MDKKNILGIIVSYNPNIHSFVENVKTISQQVDKLVIVDNNSSNKEALIDFTNFSNVEIIFNNINFGLAKAYNLALEKYAKDFKLFVTFDQDTKIVKGTLDLLEKQLFSEENIGVVGPTFSREIESICEGSLKDKTVVIQSCALFKMEVYNKIGGFAEDYFIDSIDFEYCLRMKQKGFKVKIYTGINIRHELGEIRNFGKKKLTIHNNLRNYYIARNHFKLLKKYGVHFPLFSVKLHFFFLKHIYQVIFIERNKEKIMYIKKGILNEKL